MVPAILIITVIVLAGIIIWLLYTTLTVRGSMSNSTTRKSESKQHQMSAEIFVETYRGKKRKHGRNGS